MFRVHVSHGVSPYGSESQLIDEEGKNVEKDLKIYYTFTSSLDV